ncbi:MAG: ATP-binding cassette domain-containing protein [Thiolinea sp.]
MGTGGGRRSLTPLLQTEDLQVWFPAGRSSLFGPRQWVKAVNGVSFSVRSGEVLGIVGESGCGKSTLGMAVLNLIRPTAGRALWLGQDLATLSREGLRSTRRDLQVIFQDPLASLDPRMTVGEIIAEPLVTHEPQLGRAELMQRVQAVMQQVGLLPEMLNRYPHEFSGGQAQRIGIARAIILRPRLIVCDEAVSALDVSVQAQIINLLKELQAELGMSLIFISHNISVVRYIADRIMVMYLGKVMEMAEADSLIRHPVHPYTQALMAAVPIPDPAVAHRQQDNSHLLGSDMPSPLQLPTGCVFASRCPQADEACRRTVPPLKALSATQQVACLKVG